MFDFLNLPTSQSNADVKIFTATSTSNESFTYFVPRGKTMLYGYCSSGGGGGGGGLSGIAGSQRGGGGGGGAGGQVVFLVPVRFLPDILYVVVGSGGAGGAAGSAGSDGRNTRISISPGTGTTVDNIVNITSGLGGAAGNGSGASAGGSSGTPLQFSIYGLGFHNFIGGQVGTTGGNNNTGGAVAFPTTGINVMGGTGGGGIINSAGGFSGGTITAISNSYISDSRPQSTAAGTYNGSGGLYTPGGLFYNYPGLGGRSENNDVGGNGGNGGYGCGGGGGGGGTTGGRGGDGGSGIVILIAW